MLFCFSDVRQKVGKGKETGRAASHITLWYFHQKFSAVNKHEHSVQGHKYPVCIQIKSLSDIIFCLPLSFSSTETRLVLIWIHCFKHFFCYLYLYFSFIPNMILTTNDIQKELEEAEIPRCPDTVLLATSNNLTTGTQDAAADLRLLLEYLIDCRPRVSLSP